MTRAVSLGGNSARRLLAVLTAIGVTGAPSWSDAIALVIAAAKDGDYQALRELGFLVEMAAPGSPLAADLLLRAGLKGDGLAAFAIMRRQSLQGRTLATERAFAQWREGVKRIGHPLASRIENVVAVPNPSVSPPVPQAAWDEAEDLLREPPGLNVAAPQIVSGQPVIRRFARLLTTEESEYLIGLSSPYLVPAEVLDRSRNQATQSRVRTNSVAAFSAVHLDLVVHAINLRLARAAALPATNGELLNVLMYRPGEEYRPHFDFFPIELAKADPNGQRIRTLLVYLNNDYDGGETNFVTLGLKIKGEPGDAILFHNCDAAGAPDRATLHAGLPVARGEKWLLSKWYREKAFDADATRVNAL